MAELDLGERGDVCSIFDDAALCLGASRPYQVAEAMFPSAGVVCGVLYNV